MHTKEQRSCLVFFFFFFFLDWATLLIVMAKFEVSSVPLFQTLNSSPLSMLSSFLFSCVDDISLFSLIYYYICKEDHLSKVLDP